MSSDCGRRLLVLFCVAGLALAARPAAAQTPPAAMGAAGTQAPAAAGAPLLLPGKDAPQLARLLTPRHAPAGTYSASVLDGGIAMASRAVRAALDPAAHPDLPKGAWQVESADCVQVFGTAADYDRSKLSRLCGGKTLSVVRAPIVRNGATIASVTLVSPYPDATLTRLEPGTLVILFDVVRAKQGAGGGRR